MHKGHLDEKEIYEIALSFRTAIIKAVKNYEFDRSDRMSNFPFGCCDDSCDLLAYYLCDNLQIDSKQINGVYRDDDPFNTCHHVWLILNDIIIDITADQFPSLIKHSNGIYVGVESEFYKNLDDLKLQENFNIKENMRLWKDYLVIKKYII